ncbi:MAG: hypothetical protein N4A76_17990 [Firmicutes bacterium]|jgi:hypothetical protein|nr:hypothetical protein [Bacillota bacterium]
MFDITLSDFESMMNSMDSDNMEDFSNFKEQLLQYINDETIVDEIISFIEDDMHVYSDLELFSLNETDWDAIVEFINYYE